MVEPASSVSCTVIFERPMLLSTPTLIVRFAMLQMSTPAVGLGCKTRIPAAAVCRKREPPWNRTYMRIVDMNTRICADGVAASEGRRAGSASEARAGRTGSDRGWRRSLLPVDVRGVDTLPGCFTCTYYENQAWMHMSHDLMQSLLGAVWSCQTNM